MSQGEAKLFAGYKAKLIITQTQKSKHSPRGCRFKAHNMSRETKFQPTEKYSPRGLLLQSTQYMSQDHEFQPSNPKFSAISKSFKYAHITKLDTIQGKVSLFEMP